jgi:hypothetical protein
VIDHRYWHHQRRLLIPAGALVPSPSIPPIRHEAQTFVRQLWSQPRGVHRRDNFVLTSCSAAAKSNFYSSGFGPLVREGFCDSRSVPLCETDHSSLSSMVECRLRSESWPTHEPRPGRKRMSCSCDISSDPAQELRARISTNIRWVIAHEIENVGITRRLDALSSVSAIAKIAQQTREIAAVFGNFSAYFDPNRSGDQGKSALQKPRRQQKRRCQSTQSESLFLDWARVLKPIRKS